MIFLKLVQDDSVRCISMKDNPLSFVFVSLSLMPCACTFVVTIHLSFGFKYAIFQETLFDFFAVDGQMMLLTFNEFPP